MKFNMKGITLGPELEQFRRTWLERMRVENGLLFDGDENISTAQMFIIDLMCGDDSPYYGPESMTISSDRPAQMEFEALIRARSVALAASLWECMRDDK